MGYKERERERERTERRNREREREREKRRGEVGGVKADGWIYKWESCLSESGKRRFLPRAPFHIFQFLSFFLNKFNTTFYEKNQKDYFHLKEIWTTLF
jgi:hypothetical protein